METIARFMRLGITFGYDVQIKTYYAIKRNIGERIDCNTLKSLLEAIHNNWGI